MQTGRSPLNDAGGNPLPRVQQVFRAIKLAKARPRRIRLPVTVDLLRKLYDGQPALGLDDALLFQAAFALAVYALLRVSEFTAPKTAEHDPARHANLQDLRVHPSLAYPATATMSIRCSKTDPFRNSHSVTIHATGTRDCPVAAIAKFLRARAGGRPNGPLFVLANGHFLTRAAVSTRLRRGLTNLGLKASAFAPHSFRIGGTVSLAAAGVQPYLLAILGRWKSDCFLLYLKVTPTILADVYRRLGRVTPQEVAREGHHGHRDHPASDQPSTGGR